MNRTDFQAYALHFFGTLENISSQMAALLRVRKDTVRPWIAHDDFPDWAEKELKQLAERRAMLFPSDAPCSDEWIFGIGEKTNASYLIHAVYPRFILNDIDPNLPILKESALIWLDGGIPEELRAKTLDMTAKKLIEGFPLTILPSEKSAIA